MKKWAFLILAAAVPAKAVWYGAVGKAAPKDGHALEFIYDTGSRELDEKTNGTDLKLNAHRLSLQYARGLGQGFEFLVRGTPFTSRVNFAGTSLNPDVWSVGGGFHWAPPESLGPVRVGLLATVDYSDGKDTGDDKFNWLEMGLGAGATLPLPRDFNMTGGVSMLKSDVNLEIGGTKSDYALAQEAVSYTHLDVYKRQTPMRSGSRNSKSRRKRWPHRD